MGNEDQPDPRWKSGLHFEQQHTREDDCAIVGADSCPLVTPLSLQLPHQCQEWVIGGLSDARQFLADLTEAIAEMEKVS